MAVAERLSADTVVIVADNHLTETVDGEPIVLNVESGTYYALSGIGDEVWEQVKEPVTIETVCDRIVETHDVSPETCRSDIVSFLRDLLEADLIEIRDSG